MHDNFQTIDGEALAYVSGGAFDFGSIFKHSLFGAIQGGMQSFMSEFLGQLQGVFFGNAGAGASAAAPSAGDAQAVADPQQADAAQGQ